MLGEAFLSKKDASTASLNFRQCEFFDPDYSDMLFTFAARMANAGEYEESKDFAGQYFEAHPVDPLKWAGLAKIALEKTDSIPATEFLLEGIKVDPDFQLGFRKLLRLYDSMGNKTIVSAFLSRWLSRHPGDQEMRKLWEEYSTTEILPPDFPE
jgi:tetratricopeptide (TPR) repeat protein